MISLNIRKIGDGPRCYAVWLDRWPVFLDGLSPVLKKRGTLAL